MKSFDGINDLLKVCECFFKWIGFSPVSQRVINQSDLLAGRISIVRNVIGYKEIPGTVSSAFNSYVNLANVGRSGNGLSGELQNAGYEAFKNTLDLAATATDFAGSLQDMELVNLGEYSKVNSGIFFGVDILSNLIAIKEKISQINSRFIDSVKERVSNLRKTQFFRKDVLAKIGIANNLACLLGSSVGLIGMVVGASSAFTVLGLVCTTFWILTKIAGKFYQELFVNVLDDLT